MIGLIAGAAGPILPRVGAVFFLVGVGFGIPLSVIVYRMRKLLRLGYGPEDIAVALRTTYGRKREEFVFEFGPERSMRERAVKLIGIAGFVGVAGFGLASWMFSSDFVPLAVLSGYAGVIGTAISSRWSRLRDGKGPRWSKSWTGWPGRLLGKVSSFKLGQRAVPANRPTELAIAMSAEAVYASFPKEVRESLGDVPAALRALENHARSARARIAELDAALLEAQRQPGSGGTHTAGSSERQDALVRDLTDARQRADAKLSDVVTSLENLRLDLLRLRTGTGTTEGITREVEAAKSLGVEADRLLAAAREVSDALSPRPTR
jgi:hypothetical protein